jgi:hypothetical protein
MRGGGHARAVEVDLHAHCREGGRVVLAQSLHRPRAINYFGFPFVKWVVRIYNDIMSSTSAFRSLRSRRKRAGFSRMMTLAMKAGRDRLE